MAQDPYLQVENNTGLKVQRGGITTVTSANLSVFTNLDVRDPQEVTFEVFIPPRHGTLCFNDGGGAAVAGAVIIFTQKDLAEGRLAYRHGGGDKLSDGFNVTARAREQSTERRLARGRREVHLDIGVAVRIYLESHQRPPIVLSNHLLLVEEGQDVSVSRKHLEVKQTVSNGNTEVGTVLVLGADCFFCVSRSFTRTASHRRSHLLSKGLHLWASFKRFPPMTDSGTTNQGRSSTSIRYREHPIHPTP